MQTWLVHMRAPRRLFRELGPAGFTAFQMLAGGSVFATLVHPFFLAAFLWEMSTVGAHAPNASVYGATILIGYLVSAGIAFAGLKRWRLLDCAWVLLLMPVYWLLLSLAAWRALDQLVRDPYRWEKTEHGLARNLRLLDETDALKASVRSSAAGRPRRPRGGA